VPSDGSRGCSTSAIDYIHLCGAHQALRCFTCDIGVDLDPDHLAGETSADQIVKESPSPVANVDDCVFGFYGNVSEIDSSA